MAFRVREPPGRPVQFREAAVKPSPYRTGQPVGDELAGGGLVGGALDGGALDGGVLVG